MRHPQKVLLAIARWFSDPASSRAGINAFLALSSTLDGAMLLCKRASLATADPEFADTLADYFQRAFAGRRPGREETTRPPLVGRYPACSDDCTDGQADDVNDRITDARDITDPSRDERDDDSEQAS